MQTDENVDLSEIAKFEKLASRWWDPHSEFKPLHDINPLRAGWIDQHANVKHKSVLDVGCGGGLLCEALPYVKSNGRPFIEEKVTSKYVARTLSLSSNFTLLDRGRLTPYNPSKCSES